MLKWKSQKQHDSFELTLAESWAPWLRNSLKHWWAWKSKPFDNLLKAMVKSYRGRKSKTSMKYLTTQIFPTFLDRVRFQTYSLKERTQGMYLFPCVLDYIHFFPNKIKLINNIQYIHRYVMCVMCIRVCWCLFSWLTSQVYRNLTPSSGLLNKSVEYVPRLYKKRLLVSYSSGELSLRGGKTITSGHFAIFRQQNHDISHERRQDNALQTIKAKYNSPLILFGWLEWPSSSSQSFISFAAFQCFTIIFRDYTSWSKDEIENQP